jgi:acetyl-CoA acyltransferase
MSREAVIVSAVRTAVGKSKRGALADVRPETLAGLVVKEAVRRAGGLPADEIEDVILGCAIPEDAQGMNIGRLAALQAGLPPTVAGQTVNRFCSSGLQAIALGAQSILAGMSTCVVAGGVESMSAVPMLTSKIMPLLDLIEQAPGAFAGMGQTAENVARQYGVTRADQDAFSLRSHQRAVAAQDAGRFTDEIAPVEAELMELQNGRPALRRVTFAVDEGPRRDTSLEALARLKPAFAAAGTVTAGNSSQTSDGAAAVALMERGRAEALGLRPLARFVSFAVAGVPPEIMGIGPVTAVPKALKLAGLSLHEIGLIELNEAFAAQSLAVIRELGLDEAITNINGGAIALGHPLGCTGAKLTTQLIYEMRRRQVQFGLVTMCIGGGMGAAGVFELI